MPDSNEIESLSSKKLIAWMITNLIFKKALQGTTKFVKAQKSHQRLGNQCAHFQWPSIT